MNGVVIYVVGEDTISNAVRCSVHAAYIPQMARRITKIPVMIPNIAPPMNQITEIQSKIIARMKRINWSLKPGSTDIFASVLVFFLGEHKEEVDHVTEFSFTDPKALVWIFQWILKMVTKTVRPLLALCLLQRIPKETISIRIQYG